MSINKLALLSAFAAALLAPKAAFTMDMYESMYYDIEQTIKAEKEAELYDLLADTDHIKAIYLTTKEITKKEPCIDFLIKEMNAFWRFATQQEFNNNDDEKYSQFVTEYFKADAKVLSKFVKNKSAEEIEQQYWKAFNAIKKEKAEQNYTPIKHCFNYNHLYKNLTFEDFNRILHKENKDLDKIKL